MAFRSLKELESVAVVQEFYLGNEFPIVLNIQRFKRHAFIVFEILLANSIGNHRQFY